MEAIIKRLLIVVTILGLGIGGFCTLTGQNMWDDASEKYSIAHKRVSDQFFDCMKVSAPEHCNKERDQGYRDMVWLLEIEQAGSDRKDIGLWALGVTIFVWPIFFLGRWIITGRLRGKQSAASGTP